MEYTSEHYVFHCKENSLAEEEIASIMPLQEGCYSFISTCLDTQIEGKIHYHLFDTPEEVGREYAFTHKNDDDEPCNGFALPREISEDREDHIYAVYNDSVKCIGFHEDAHILSYNLGRLESKFLREGLAMYFDRCWWGIDNLSWTRYYMDEGWKPSLRELLENSLFDRCSDAYTYPIAGAFTAYLIERFGRNRYIDFYKRSAHEGTQAFLSVYEEPIDSLEKHFLSYVRMFPLREEIRELIKKDLKE